MRIWDLDERKLIGRPLHFPSFVLGLAFSPDGSQLAIPFGAAHATRDGIEVRDVGTGAGVATLHTEDELRSVAFSPDGRLLAGGQVNGEILLWETDGWTRVGAALPPGGGQVLAVAFASDGRTLAGSYAEAEVALWDVESQQTIGSLPVPGGPDAWFTARFTADGSRLFVLTDYGNGFRWDVDPAAWRRQACVVAGAGPTPEQWEQVVPEQDYISVCPSG